MVESVFHLLKAKDSWWRNRHLFALREQPVSLFGAQSYIRYYSYGSFVSILESRIVSVRDGTKQIAIVEAFCPPFRQVPDSNLV